MQIDLQNANDQLTGGNFLKKKRITFDQNGTRNVLLHRFLGKYEILRGGELPARESQRNPATQHQVTIYFQWQTPRSGQSSLGWRLESSRKDDEGQRPWMTVGLPGPRPRKRLVPLCKDQPE